MPFYLEIIVTIALVLFILWNLLAVIFVFVLIRSTKKLQAKAEETMDSVQAAAYTVGENSGVFNFLLPMASFFSPKKKGILDILFSLIKK